MKDTFRGARSPHQGDGARDRHEALHRAVLDALEEGVMTVTDDGSVLDANAAVLRLLGLTRDDLARPRWFETLRPRHEDGSAITELTSPLAAVRRTGKPLRDIVLSVRHPSGGKRYFALNVLPLPVEQCAIVISLRDVTERKGEELRMRRLERAHRWAERLRAALAEDRLTLYAQPIIDLRTGRRTSDELLVRFVDEDGSIVPPGEFLAAAEEFGLMPAIDRWVICRAARLAASGRRVHLNLSASSLGDPALFGFVRDALQEAGAPGDNVVFEITETAVMRDLPTAREFGRRVEALGARMALDDFGTGFSTLQQLKRLPARMLKIDIEFVRDLTTSAESRHVVEAVVGLARRFGQQTVAEGVEDEEVQDILKGLGVDCAQGYHFGRPARIAGAV